MQKSLDIKLARIHHDPSCRDFILADAKDADMAFGLAAPGRSPEHHATEGRFRSLVEYRELIRQVVEQRDIDIALMSCSSNDVLTIQQRLFDNSPVTPAVRANDTTDIWLAAGTGRYGSQPSLPFRSTTIDHVMCGTASCDDRQPAPGADLGLYSITFNNDAHADRASLEAYRAFRLEAEQKGFRHFLEVFAPNACEPSCPEDTARFVNDSIVRALAGVPRASRPLFLKIPYFGPAAMEQLVSFDPSLIVGILGGSAGTTYDAYHMLWEAKRYGARVALYGRKINNAEDQVAFVRFLRAVADDQMLPEEAVRAYHDTLGQQNITPRRSLERDLEQTASSISYGQSTSTSPTDPKRAAASSAPDFSQMSSAEKVQWNLERWRRILD